MYSMIQRCLEICAVWHQRQAEVIPELCGIYKIIWARMLEDDADQSNQAPLFPHYKLHVFAEFLGYSGQKGSPTKTLLGDAINKTWVLSIITRLQWRWLAAWVADRTKDNHQCNTLLDARRKEKARKTEHNMEKNN